MTVNQFRLTLDVVLLGKLLGTLRSLGVAKVPKSNVGTHLGVGLSNGPADTGGSTGDDGSLSLEGEALHDGSTIDPTLVIVDKVTSVEWVKIRHGDSCVELSRVLWEKNG